MHPSSLPSLTDLPPYTSIQFGGDGSRKGRASPTRRVKHQASLALSFVRSTQQRFTCQGELSFLGSTLEAPIRRRSRVKALKKKKKITEAVCVVLVGVSYLLSPCLLDFRLRVSPLRDVVAEGTELVG